MKAVIMAGGLGNRLRPLTCTIPKPMMPIVNKPVIQYTIELLKRNGIQDIAITLQYMADEIMNYFEDGSRFGVNITYFIEDIPLGTGGSVKNAEEFLDNTFIVISGDALINIDLKKVIEYHKNKKALATLITKKVNTPLEYGVVITNYEGKIIKFLEKPSWSEVFSDNVNTGIYILEPSVLSYYNKNEKFDFSKDLFPLLLKNNEPIFAYTTNGYWCDIGTFKDYHKCNLELLKGILNLNISGKKLLQDNIWIGDNCEISSKAKIIPPVFIGNNTSIHSYAEIGPYTVVGDNNIINASVTIRKSVTFNNCYVGDYCEIRGAILGKGVKIKENTKVFENSIIGDNSLLENNVIVKPSVKIWPEKLIKSRAIVSWNYKWGEKYSKIIFKQRGISGIINVDITPEFVSKLVSAAANVLKNGEKIIVSCSDSTPAEMIKYSVVSGLLSMGIEVYDLKTMPIFVARYSVTFLKADGAIYVKVDKNNSNKVTILFMDKNGIEIDDEVKRKIENNFNREEFRRITTEKIKKIKYISNIEEIYIKNIINRLNINHIRNNNYKIILSCNNNIIVNIIKNMATKVKASVILYNENFHLKELKNQVVKNKANIGIYIDNEGEEAIIIDEFGNVIEKENYKSLKAFIMLKMCNLSTLVVPVNASNAMKNIANICGAKFIKTKISHKNILQTYIDFEKTLSVKDIVSKYLLTLDPVGNLMFVLNLMVIYKSTLSKIISVLPQYYNDKKQIYCPWHKKGKVMRELIEKSDNDNMEVIEGVKLNYEDSWALIIPDSDEPLCKIYIESTNKDKGERLGRELIKKIEKILDDNSSIKGLS